MVAIVCGPRAVAHEDLAATVVQREIRRLRLPECRSPFALNRDLLVRREQTATPQGGPLLSVRRAVKVRPLEFVKAGRPTTRVCSLHQLVPAGRPGRFQLFARVEQRA